VHARLIHDSVGPPRTNSSLIGSAIFAQWCHSLPIHSPKICPLLWEIWTPSNAWLLGPTWPNTNTSSRLSQPFFHITPSLPTDRPTDEYQQAAYATCATRSNNNNNVWKICGGKSLASNLPTPVLSAIYWKNWVSMLCSFFLTPVGKQVGWVFINRVERISVFSSNRGV